MRRGASSGIKKSSLPQHHEKQGLAKLMAENQRLKRENQELKYQIYRFPQNDGYKEALEDIKELSQN